MTASEIIIGKPNSDRDRMMTSKVKSMFVQGTKICVISPGLQSIHEYDRIVGRCKTYEDKRDSEIEIRKHIDMAFDYFLEMGFTNPLSQLSLLVIEYFDRLLTYIRNDERLMRRLTNIIRLSNQDKISVWIAADSHQSLCQPKYNIA